MENWLTADQYFGDDLPLVVIKHSQHSKTGLHRHEFFEMVFIERGVSLHSHEGQIQILTAGDLFLVLPGEAHSYISTHNTDLYNCLFDREAFLCFQSDIENLPELSFIFDGRSAEPVERVHAGTAQRHQIGLLMEQISWEMANRPIGWPLKCKSLLAELFLIYARLLGNSRQEAQESGANFRRIMKAVAYIEEHYNQEITVHEVAQAAGLSAGYLSRQFRHFLGTTPLEYARNFRMAKAAELLSDEEKSVASVASELGFGDTASFSRQFRQITGISPTGFRKSI
ncbi:MAG: helix-turn-helix domain-containing protein [Clostridia bacterium]|nr:helix-turn-helix domain-containing protein [Clostridia bacterium]